jgi:universal stress protein E
MPLPQRILVVVDPTAEQQPAVERAAWIARATRSRVELFICAYDSQPFGGGTTDAVGLARARVMQTENQLRRLNELARPLIAEGIAVDVDALWDAPLHEGIVRKALASNADLVIKDTHYHSLLRRSIFSNTDWNLIRECPLPLWLAKPRAVAAKPCIVAAVDPVHERDKPAELDHEILTVAAELGDALRGSLEVFHAFDVTPVLATSVGTIAMPLMLPVPELIDAVRERHGSAVHELTDGHGIARDRVHIEHGGTRDRLMAVSERLGADLVVMGAVSRKGLARAFIGNTAEEVLDRLGCDLLIVKPSVIAAVLRRRAA